VSLGKLGQGNRKVRARLIELLDDRNFWARLSAIDALEELHDLAASPALERLAAQDIEGRLKGAAANAVRAIAEYQEKPVELRQLRGEIEKLRENNKSLLDRIDRLETRSKSKR
jgi:aminopeptidase N